MTAILKHLLVIYDQHRDEYHSITQNFELHNEKFYIITSRGGQSDYAPKLR